MKLFIKHLFRSTQRKPLQPLLLVLTLMLAVMTSVFTFSLHHAIEEENSTAQRVTYGSADLTISLDGASSSRFMFATDAEQILGDEARVAGLLEMPLAMDGKSGAVSACAVDFSTIERIFPFSFIEYGGLTPSGVSTAAFVSKNFADENGLRCGDGFTVTAFGTSRTYTVVGISAEPLISTYDVIVDIGGVVRLIAGDSLLLSSMKDGFRPCSTIYIDVTEGNAADFAQRLSASPRFAENTITDVSDAVQQAANTESFSVIIDISIILACTLAASAAFCCLYILSLERTEQNRSFMLSGARASHLHAMQYLEVLVYWAIGCVLGVGLAVPVLRLFWRGAGFRYASAALRPIDALLGAIVILGVAMLTVFIFTFSEKMRWPASENKKPIGLFVFPLALTLCMTALIFVLPVDSRAVLYVPFLLLLSVCIFIYVGPMLRAFMRFIDKRLDKRREKTKKDAPLSLRYAVKNVYSVRILHNTARLCTLLLYLVISVVMVITSALGYMKFVKQSVAAEYAVVGATESCYEKASSSELISDCYKLYMQNATVEGENFFAIIGASDMAAIADGIRPQRAPKGEYAAVSLGIAHEHSLKLGDTFVISVSNQEIKLVVGELLDVGAGCVLVDNEALGLHYNMLALNGKEGVTEAELFSDLSRRTSSELATMMSMDELWESKMDHLVVYLASGVFLLIIIVAFALIGILDNLGQSYRARRDDFRLYRLSGMSGRGVRRMKCAEIAITLVFSLILAVAASAVFLVTTNMAMRAYAYEIVMHIESFFTIK